MRRLASGFTGVQDKLESGVVTVSKDSLPKNVTESFWFQCRPVTAPLFLKEKQKKVYHENVLCQINENCWHFLAVSLQEAASA